MNILQLCGKKQSGKTTTSNYIVGKVLKQKSIINDFIIGSNGKLYIHAEMELSGRKQVSEGELDMTRRDDDFAEYASHNIWPHIKVYNFADYLKYFVADIFNLSEEKLFGTDEDKNEQTHISWKSMPIPRYLGTAGERNTFINKRGYMTYREILQVFGTDVCRYINPKCWAHACYKQIQKDQPDIAIIGDCRFENEIETGIENGANLILCQNSDSKDKHKSETGLDNIDPKVYTYIMPDKQTITIDERSNHIDLFIVKCGLSYLI